MISYQLVSGLHCRISQNKHKRFLPLFTKNTKFARTPKNVENQSIKSTSPSVCVWVCKPAHTLVHHSKSSFYLYDAIKKERETQREFEKSSYLAKKDLQTRMNANVNFHVWTYIVSLYHLVLRNFAFEKTSSQFSFPRYHDKHCCLQNYDSFIRYLKKS